MPARRKKADAPDAGNETVLSVATTEPPAPPPPSPEAVLQVRAWIVEGQQAADIVESIEASFPDEWPNVLLSAALSELGKEAAEIDVDLANGFLLNAYREIYRRAFSISDFGSALAALRSFERVVGGSG